MFNQYELPERKQLSELRRTGRHTLLRLYMQILRELNTITLRPLDLSTYDRMPKIIGKFRVTGHDRFRKLDRGIDLFKLTEDGLTEIISRSNSVSLKQYFLDAINCIPQGAELTNDLESLVYEYNPKRLPPYSGIRARRCR